MSIISAVVPAQRLLVLYSAIVDVFSLPTSRHDQRGPHLAFRLEVVSTDFRQPAQAYLGKVLASVTVGQVAEGLGEVAIDNQWHLHWHRPKSCLILSVEHIEGYLRCDLPRLNLG